MSERYCVKHASLHKWKPRPISNKQKKLADKKYNDSQRNSERNAFYHSKQWSRSREYIYARDMATCQVCGNAVTNRKVIDHIIPLKYCTLQQRLSPDNLWTLCYRCHSLKTKLEEIIANGNNGSNKIAHISKENWKKYIKKRIE
ncbi:HNH endonuclease [Liquorilactobacillus satsumensis]|uniref:HNH endonuclease n=1 Tax=Liquorilactobacillus satsumensis TaxID=259059 RepID=UPI0009E7A6BF